MNVEKGNVLEDAAQAAGLGRTACYDWRARGEAALVEAFESVPEGPERAGMLFEELLERVAEREVVYAQFAERLARALAKAKVDVHNITHGIAQLGASPKATPCWRKTSVAK